MPISVTCPSCDRLFRVADEYAGRRGRCPDCGDVVRVPVEQQPQFDLTDDEERDSVEDDSPRRRRRTSRPSPQDHLPAWGRVSLGFLIQQFGVAINLIALLLVIAAMTVLSDDPGDFEKEPGLAETMATLFGALAAMLGAIVLVVGRFMSAATPVKSPRIPGLISAIGTAMLLPAMCVAGGLAVVAGGDPAGDTIIGLGMLAYMGLWVGCEATHGFAMGGVGRVLRADQLRIFGRALAVVVILAGFFSLVSICALGLWMEAQNPNGQNPAATKSENQLLLGWLVGTGLVAGLYLMSDLVLLQQGRTAIARIADFDESRPTDDEWH